MKKNTIFAGLDVHKNSIVVALADAGHFPLPALGFPLDGYYLYQGGWTRLQFIGSLFSAQKPQWQQIDYLVKQEVHHDKSNPGRISKPNPNVHIQGRQ